MCSGGPQTKRQKEISAKTGIKRFWFSNRQRWTRIPMSRKLGQLLNVIRAEQKVLYLEREIQERGGRSNADHLVCPITQDKKNKYVPVVLQAV